MARSFRKETPRDLPHSEQPDSSPISWARAIFLRDGYRDNLRSGRGKVETVVGPLHCLITLEVQTGDTVLLGFRPAAFLVAKDGCAGAINTFRAQISSMTFAGDYLECEVRVQDQPLRVLLDPYQEFKTGDVISLHIPQDRLATVARL